MKFVLYYVLIYPLELVFQMVYTIAERYVQNPGLSIIFLSLAMNLLVLPLYLSADKLQLQQQEVEKKLSPVISHIKKSFSGDERFFMLQNLYRENNYSPLGVLKESFPLLLQIPFFIAAYHFLSHLGYIKGVQFGPINDLGSPDGLIVIGSIAINVLPILMTLINCISSMIYTRGLPLKSKLQLYITALVFLVFLYNSPSGLVFYWTLNNIFALGKNVVMKMPIKKPQLPKIKDPEKYFSISNPKYDRIIFFFSCVFVAFQVGVLPVSNILVNNYQDYIRPARFMNPLHILLVSAFTSVGVFIVWFGVFYLFANKTARKLMSIFVWIFGIASIYNTTVFGEAQGNLFFSSAVYSFCPSINNNKFIYFVIVFTICVLAYIFWGNTKKLTTMICVCLAIGSCVMGVININKCIKLGDNPYYLNREKYATSAPLTFSQNGQNVVVLMMDRQISEYIPYIMDNNPEIKDSFSGFTYYPNTISFGDNTLTGNLGLFGGYEYTPMLTSIRSDVSLQEKQNEADLLMPILFMNEGYNVTVCDPVYANYQIISDLSIYDDYPQINAYVTNGAYSSSYSNYELISSDLEARQIRNHFFLGLMQCCPEFMWSIIYDNGNYNYLEYEYLDASLSCELAAFFDAYGVLDHMSDMTNIVSDGDYFLMMDNMTPHEATLISSNDYGGSVSRDDGTTISVSSDTQLYHYQVNEVSLRSLARWLDYLKESGVYDNTRIIIVSDHGYTLGYHINPNGQDVGSFFATLLVKDFNSTGSMVVSDEPMTNADVPFITVDGLIDNPTNPFTGTPINLSFLKHQGDDGTGNGILHPFDPNPWNPTGIDTASFEDGYWMSVYGPDFTNVESWDG